MQNCKIEKIQVPKDSLMLTFVKFAFKENFVFKDSCIVV